MTRGNAFDVAVVGFGPVGAVAANLLGRAGLRTAVIDKSAEVTPLPRAIAFDHEIMRVFQNIGIAAEIDEYVAPYVATEFRGMDGEPIARFKSAPPPFNQGWAPNYVFNQPKVETAIRRKAATYETVHVFLSETLEELACDAAGGFATLRLRAAGGSTRDLTARYVIACDGAASTIRRILEIPLRSLDFDRPFLVVDALVGEPALSRLPSTNVQYCEARRPTTYIIGPGNHRRWETMLLDGERAQAANEREFIRCVLERWIAPGEAEILRAATYEFHALVAAAWRRQRVFLAGDAAHQTPPFMGQGMCQGIRDVVNLAWKLELVLRHGAKDALLDSYEAERISHVRATTETTIELGRVICETDPAKATARDDSLRQKFGVPPRFQFRQDLVPPLRHGLLLADGTGLAGALLPQPFVGVGGQPYRLLDDVAGTRFRLIVTDGFAGRILASVCSELGSIDADTVVLSTGTHSIGLADALIVQERDRQLQDWLEAAGCGAVLVRPDHYVYAGIRDAEQLSNAITQLIHSLFEEARH